MRARLRGGESLCWPAIRPNPYEECQGVSSNKVYDYMGSGWALKVEVRLWERIRFLDR